MPPRDAYHQAVRNALVKDGWQITHDPFTITFGSTSVFADLGAERLIAATKDRQKIAAEVKTFGGPSDARDLELALGQFVYYYSLLSRIEPDRTLYLAVTNDVFEGLLSEPGPQAVIEDRQVALVTFNAEREEILKWMT